MQDDIENQFCIIDQVNNCILNNNIELVNLHSSQDYISKINNKLRKSKSYPNENTINYINNNNDIHKNNINKNISYKNKLNIDNIANTDNLDNQIDNSNVSTNLIEKNNNIKSFICGLKKIFNYSIYFTFIINFIPLKINKIETLNKFLTIFLHIFIMIIFEIFFYFNYVVWIEKNEFINQINKYLKQLNYFSINPIQKQIIKYEINSNNDKYMTQLEYLHDQYINSEHLQKKLLHQLLIKACTMAGIVGIILIILFIIGLLYRKKIKWNWIWIENLLMFVFLGIFEYLFFTNIIMNYNPITDAEVKYYVVNGIVKYYNSTN